jgi:hypothetical protein
MHGVILVELKKFVEARLGETAWEELQGLSGLAGRVYLPVQEYPDSEVEALLERTMERARLDRDGLEQEFGEFMAPDLLRMYGSLLERGWKTFEVVEHAGATIHRVMRARNADARALRLSAERTPADTLLVTYASERRMCGLAKGIVRGLARHFRERVSVAESACMRQGAPACRIELRRTGDPAQRPEDLRPG